LIGEKTSEGSNFDLLLQGKEQYEKLADYLVHLIRDDPSAPKESLHTIIYRIKDEARLIEKSKK